MCFQRDPEVSQQRQCRYRHRRSWTRTGARSACFSAAVAESATTTVSDRDHLDEEEAGSESGTAAELRLKSNKILFIEQLSLT